LSGSVAYFCRTRAVKRRLQRLLALCLLVTGLLAAFARPGEAQTLSPAEREQLTAKKETLFQQTLRNPANLDVTFAYAEVSARLGDNEAAVSALERMLLFNPNLPRVQLELGALYFRMGSYEISRTYFEKARAAHPPPEVTERIDTYLAQINRLSATQTLTGYFFMGGQYQSDANLAPGSPLVHSPIGDVLLNNQFVKMESGNFFATGQALYSYDLGTQSRDTIEVLGTGFANHYTRGAVNRLDLGLVELTAGPRFNFINPLPWAANASIKPYAIANDVSLGGNQYFHSFGVGLENTAVVLDDVRLKSVFEFRDKTFENAPDRPASTALTGSDKLVSLFVTKPLTTTPFASELNLELDFLAQDTRVAFYSNKTYGGTLSYRMRYDDPLNAFHFPWETTFFVSRSWANYAAPDPCCVTSASTGGFSTRLDRRWRFGVSEAIQVTSDVAVLVQLQRDIVSSSVPIYAYSSNSILVGPQIRF
jgi:tetratricopeptide (TPR) repeat protein